VDAVTPIDARLRPVKQATPDNLFIWVSSSVLAHGLALALIFHLLPTDGGTRPGERGHSLRVSLVSPPSNQAAKPRNAAVPAPAKKNESATPSMTVARVRPVPTRLPPTKTPLRDTPVPDVVAQTISDKRTPAPLPSERAQSVAQAAFQVSSTKAPAELDHPLPGLIGQRPMDVHQPKAEPAPGQRNARVEAGKLSVPRSEARARDGAADHGKLLGLLHREISRRKRYPFMARRRHVEGTATVGFSLNSAGIVRGAGVVDSSGHGMLDRAAVAAVEGISPFGAAAAYLGEERDFRVQVAFRLR